MGLDISGKTQLICLLGSPVDHSISPAMHNLAFSMLGLDYVYLAFDVKEDKLEETVKGLKLLNVRGWNLTMPNKTKMLELLDSVSPAAELIGAVNTVVNDNGTLKGHTTDGSGYMRMLLESGVDVIGKKMVIAGAGGAARAIAAQAALDGVSKITLFNRDVLKVEKLAEVLNHHTNCVVEAYGLNDERELKRAIGEAAVFTNATKVGMEPDADAAIIKDASLLYPELVVSDIVYNPKKTKLLQMAEEQGCKTIGGMGMLLWQGADAFRLWTGCDMPAYAVQRKYFK